MIALIFLLCISIYCLYKCFKENEDIIYMGIGFTAAFAFITFVIVATAVHIESSAAFEESKEIRKYLEYQIDNPFIKDDNFFEQLSNYNAAILKNQKYNKDYIFTGIGISNKWDTIAPLEITK